MSLPWPEGQVALLRKMHAQGARPGAVATAMGITSNAVRMKAGRLGLKFGRRVHWRMGQPRECSPPPPAAVLDLTLRAAADCQHASARSVAAYLAHVELGCAKSGIGRALGVTGARIGQMVRLVEDRRDRPDFDEWLDDLGRQVREMAA